MIKYLVPLLLLFACTPPKVTHFFCITPFGVAQAGSDDPHVKATAAAVYIDQETQTIRVPRGLCTEINEK